MTIITRNTINAYVEFDFKGESYAPSATIDLDQLLANPQPFPSIHLILASTNNIDTYSYLYEAMLEAEIQFDCAQGLAAEFLQEGSFNQAEFIAKWHETKVVALLQPIASQMLGVDNLDQHSDLGRALIQAYELGKQAGNKES